MLATVLTSLAGRDGRGALPRWVLPLVFGFALAMRLAVSTHPHSGEGVPPMFGDFEAQRHWMEITIHTPLREWYVSTKANDLKYWGLDYPPLTAYQSWLYGKCVAALEPEAVRLTTPITMTLEQAIAYIDDDELVEVTPNAIRLRKRYLDPHERKRQSRAS